MKPKEPRFELIHRNRHFTKIECYECGGQEQHWHEEYQIELVTAGEGTHLLNGKPFPLHRGQMYVTRLRDFHELQITEVATIHRITLPELCMPERFVRSMLKRKDNLITQMDEETTKHIENMFLLIESRPEAKSVEEIYMQESLLNVIIMLFTNQVNVNPADDFVPDHKKVYDTLLFIQDNFRQKLTLQMVADHMKMNPTYLNRILRAHTGVTVYSAIKQARLKYAAKLCRDTELMSKDICKMCNYSDVSNFQRDFHKAFGVSPLDYRKAARAGLFDADGNIIDEVYNKKINEQATTTEE